MKKAVSCLMAGAVILAAGCTGPFALTQKVHTWQTSFEDKWVDEAAFLGCVIFPVYSIAALGDTIIFNSVEFWTGENPLCASLSEDGQDVQMTSREDGSILIESNSGSCILEKDASGVSALDADGNVLYTATTQGDQVLVYDAQGELVRSFTKS